MIKQHKVHLPFLPSENRLVHSPEPGCEVCPGPGAVGRKGCVQFMVQGFRKTVPWVSPPGFRISMPLGWLAVLAVVMLAGRVLTAQEQTEPIDDITGKYHFLSADDTLAILDEEGKLKGYIDILQT